MELWGYWLLIIIILTTIEVITTNLVSVWFIASAIISLIVSFFTDSFLIQFAIFVLGGAIFLLLTKPLLKKKLATKKIPTNIDRILGMKGKVTEKIMPNEIGEVYVDGKKWSAYSNETIEINELVIIEAINGVKLKVKEVKESD